MQRKRTIYFFIIVAIMLLGLLTRKMWNYLPPFVNTYLGDAIWAMMIFFMAGFLFHKTSTLKTGLIAILFCYIIEISQLYHAPWIDAIRNTRLGGLVLGFGFLWSDIVAYTIGIGAGLLTERWILLSKNHKHKN